MATVFLNTIHSTFSVQGGAVSEPLYTKYFCVDCGSRASGEKYSRGALLPSHQTQASSGVIDRDECEILKSLCEDKTSHTKSAHAVHPFDNGSVVLVILKTGLRNKPKCINLWSLNRCVADINIRYDGECLRDVILPQRGQRAL